MKGSGKPPQVGRGIQKLRKESSLSLDDLAKRSGVSKSMLSQIESEKVNPTIATVWKIANGLGVTLQILLEGWEEPLGKFTVTRAKDVVVLDSPDENIHFKVLSPLSMEGDLEFYLLKLKNRSRLESASHYNGTEECLTILKGIVKVTVSEQSTELHEGDFITYHADKTHIIENPANEPAQIHMVVRHGGKKSYNMEQV
jgi:transcriptional regulator with XRE-family HTH domain